MNVEVKEKEEVKVDRVAEIAQEKIKEMKEQKEEADSPDDKKTGEAGDASADSSPETKKTTEDGTDKGQVEPEPKPDNEDDQDSKVQKIKDSTQKRIDELTGELKAEREARTNDSEKIAELEAKIDAISDGKDVKPDAKDAVDLKEIEQIRINKYVEEDLDKPREERREMSKEEMDEWHIDDPVALTEWIQERNHRRREEKEQDQSADMASKEADRFIKNQNQSREKLVDKYPDIDQAKRGAELKAEGKTDVEITNILKGENEVFKTMMEIVESDPKKYIQAENGPELVMAEMDKRFGKEDSKDEPKTYTEAELQKIREEGAELERQRLANIDSSVTSTSGATKPVEGSPEYKKGLETFLMVSKKKGKDWTKEDYDKVLERRRNIPGVNTL